MSKRNIEKHILMNKAEAQDLQKKGKTGVSFRRRSYPFASQMIRAERKARRKILRCYA